MPFISVPSLNFITNVRNVVSNDQPAEDEFWQNSGWTISESSWRESPDSVVDNGSFEGSSGGISVPNWHNDPVNYGNGEVTPIYSFDQGRAYFPFIFSLFMFIFFCNFIGLIPYTFTVTSHLIVTFAFAGLIFLAVTIIGFMKNGLGYLRIFYPSGIPI